MSSISNSEGFPCSFHLARGYTTTTIPSVVSNAYRNIAVLRLSAPVKKGRKKKKETPNCSNSETCSVGQGSTLTRYGYQMLQIMQFDMSLHIATSAQVSSLSLQLCEFVFHLSLVNTWLLFATDAQGYANAGAECRIVWCLSSAFMWHCGNRSNEPR